MYRLNSGIRNRQNAHAKVRNWIYDVHFSGKRSELGIIANDFWSSTISKPRNWIYLWIKLVFTKNFVFISSWSSFSQPINFFVVDILTRAAGSPTFNLALVRAKFFFWTSFECTFGLFDGSFFFVRLFLNIIEPHPSVKWRGYTVSVLPEAGLITVEIILTGINWGWVEGKEVWCLPLWLFFFFFCFMSKTD